MRTGIITSTPNSYSRFGRIIDDYGVGHTIETGDLPEDVEENEEYAYKVELWGNDGGLAYQIYED